MSDIKYNGTLLSNKLLDIRQTADAEKIEFRLLSGEYVVQTVGVPISRYNIECIVDASGAKLINEAYGISGILEMTGVLGENFSGYITTEPSFSTFRKGANPLYLCNIAVNRI